MQLLSDWAGQTYMYNMCCYHWRICHAQWPRDWAWNYWKWIDLVDVWRNRTSAKKFLDYTNFNCFLLCSTILGSVCVCHSACSILCIYVHIAACYTVKKNIIYTLLEIIDIPVGQPTKVKPYLVEAASKLERGLGRFVGDSNIRIFLICLKLKS